jgi:hypothetical protein
LPVIALGQKDCTRLQRLGKRSIIKWARQAKPGHYVVGQPRRVNAYHFTSLKRWFQVRKDGLKRKVPKRHYHIHRGRKGTFADREVRKALFYGESVNGRQGHKPGYQLGEGKLLFPGFGLPQPTASSAVHSGETEILIFDKGMDYVCLHLIVSEGMPQVDEGFDIIEFQADDTAFPPEFDDGESSQDENVTASDLSPDSDTLVVESRKTYDRRLKAEKAARWSAKAESEQRKGHSQQVPPAPAEETAESEIRSQVRGVRSPRESPQWLLRSRSRGANEREQRKRRREQRKKRSRSRRRRSRKGANGEEQRTSRRRSRSHFWRRRSSSLRGERHRAQPVPRSASRSSRSVAAGQAPELLDCRLDWQRATEENCRLEGARRQYRAPRGQGRPRREGTELARDMTRAFADAVQMQNVASKGWQRSGADGGKAAPPPAAELWPVEQAPVGSWQRDTEEDWLRIGDKRKYRDPTVQDRTRGLSATQHEHRRKLAELKSRLAEKLALRATSRGEAALNSHLGLQAAEADGEHCGGGPRREAGAEAEAEAEAEGPRREAAAAAEAHGEQSISSRGGPRREAAAITSRLATVSSKFGSLFRCPPRRCPAY